MNNSQFEYVKEPKNYADDTSLQSALRELHTVATNKRVWLVMVAAIAILAISGPFGTFEHLNQVPRFFYWGAIAILTFFSGVFFATLAHTVFEKVFRQTWLANLLSGLAPALPISLIVWFANIAVFGNGFSNYVAFSTLFINCLIVSFAIFITYSQMRGSRIGEDETRPATLAQIPFFKRLPVELGKNLLYISSQDHYVEAVTERGSHLILMRLSDAIAELEALDGMQIHRAHWVVKSAVKTSLRENNRLLVEMSNGTRLSVSRTYVKEVRAALGQ